MPEKLPRCANGTRRNKISKKCEQTARSPHKRSRRCTNGTHRNKLTGECDAIIVSKDVGTRRRRRTRLRKAYRSRTPSPERAETPVYSSATLARANKKYAAHVRAVRDRVAITHNKLMSAYSEIKKTRKAITKYDTAVRNHPTMENRARLQASQHTLAALIASLPKLETDLNKADGEYMALPVMHTPAWSDEHRTAAKYVMHAL